MARRKKLPGLASTARFYEKRTRRTRLASPGIEHYRPRRPHPLRWVAAAILALVVLVVLLLRSMLP